MKRIKTLIKKLKAFDVVVISFSIFLILLHVIFHSKIENSLTWIFINLVVISIAFGISYLEALNDKKGLAHNSLLVHRSDYPAYVQTIIFYGKTNPRL